MDIETLTVTLKGAVAQAIRNGAANMGMTTDAMAQELILTTLLLYRDEHIKTTKIGGVSFTEVVCPPCADEDSAT